MGEKNDTGLSGVVMYWWSTSAAVKNGIALDYWVDGNATPSLSVKLDDPARQGLYWANRNPFDGESTYTFDEVNNEFDRILKQRPASGYYGYRYTNFTSSIRVAARTLNE